ncbi:GNAT family N-acetyltransferase [Natronomonas sp. EA1]|uniref:GNAT family N-acetyltransferase n=1 Tax=Natronomonas sp. EA1 TaxID=3421655 RepID=UPI003EC0308F
MFPESIETPRLRLERLSRDSVDVFDCYERRSHHELGIEAVTEYLPWDPHETVKETHDYISDLESQWDDGTRAEYVIRPKDGASGTGEIIGSGGLIVDWEKRLGKPAIWLRKPYWGHGYSGERADAMLELAFDRLDLELVAVPVQDGNDRSRRAVERYVERHGGQYEGLFRHSAVRPDGTVIDHHRYSVTREAYRSERN